MKKEKGFSLIELLIVIAIIAILSAIAITSFANVQKNARDAKRKADISILFRAIELYKAEKGDYPGSVESAGRNSWSDSDLNPSDYLTNIAPMTGGILPTDPLNNESFHYSYKRFNPGSFGCENKAFFILGVKQFENSPKLGAWKCPDHDFSTDFDWAIGGYE